MDYEDQSSDRFEGGPIHMKTDQGCQAPDLIDGGLTQIFIKTLTGKSVGVRIWIWVWVQVLQQKIHEQLGIPIRFQNLIYAGKSLQEGFKL